MGRGVTESPAVRFVCTGCGGPVLEVRRLRGAWAVVTDAEDGLYRSTGRRSTRTDPELGRFRAPLVHDPDRVLWPLAIRCREDGSAHVLRSDVDDAVAEFEGTGRMVRRKVHLRPGRPK